MGDVLGAGSGVEVLIGMNELERVAARFPGALDAILSAAAERVAAYAKAHHPWQNETGETEASIHMEQTDAHEFAAVAGGAMIYLEWGTMYMPPFPTMQPAYDAVKPSLDDSLTKITEKITS